jgi:hypothetical protein
MFDIWSFEKAETIRHLSGQELERHSLNDLPSAYLRRSLGGLKGEVK